MLKSILVTTENGKPQTTNSRLPFTVNAMLKVTANMKKQEDLLDLIIAALLKT